MAEQNIKIRNYLYCLNHKYALHGVDCIQVIKVASYSLGRSRL